MKHLRFYLMLAALAVAGGVAACSDTSTPIEPAGPSLDCGGYLGGGGGRSDTLCIQSTTPPPPADSI